VLGDPVNFVDIYGLSVWGVIWNFLTCGKSVKDAAGHFGNANDLKEQCEKLNQSDPNKDYFDDLWDRGIAYEQCRHENNQKMIEEVKEGTKAVQGLPNKATGIGNKGVRW